jgi:16S rRNA pseudouridine516 synthase
MRLDRYLESRLSSSARTVRLMLAERRVHVNGSAAKDPRLHISRFCRVEADGEVLQARAPVYLMLHKPRGCVSATRDGKHPSVLGLIDHPLRAELHLAGRLDFNTTGLLLLTNDGDWSSAITLPGRRIPKTYRVETRDPITPEYAERFRAGVYFRHEDLHTLPAELEVLAPRLALLTLHEGRYHQVKRMFGTFRNPVLALHRVSIGAVALDDALSPGHYRALIPEEVACLRGGPRSTETRS